MPKTRQVRIIRKIGDESRKQRGRPADEQAWVIDVKDSEEIQDKLGAAGNKESIVYSLGALATHLQMGGSTLHGRLKKQPELGVTLPGKKGSERCYTSQERRLIEGEQRELAARNTDFVNSHMISDRLDVGALTFLKRLQRFTTLPGSRDRKLICGVPCKIFRIRAQDEHRFPKSFHAFDLNLPKIGRPTASPPTTLKRLSQCFDALGLPVGKAERFVSVEGDYHSPQLVVGCEEGDVTVHVLPAGKRRDKPLPKTPLAGAWNPFDPARMHVDMSFIELLEACPDWSHRVMWESRRQSLPPEYRGFVFSDELCEQFPKLPKDTLLTLSKKRGWGLGVDEGYSHVYPRGKRRGGTSVIYSREHARELRAFYRKKYALEGWLSPNQFAERVGVGTHRVTEWVARDEDVLSLFGCPVELHGRNMLIPPLSEEQFSELAAIQGARSKRDRLKQMLGENPPTATYHDPRLRAEVFVIASNERAASHEPEPLSDAQVTSLPAQAPTTTKSLIEDSYKQLLALLEGSREESNEVITAFNRMLQNGMLNTIPSVLAHFHNMPEATGDRFPVILGFARTINKISSASSQSQFRGMLDGLTHNLYDREYTNFLRQVSGGKP